MRELKGKVDLGRTTLFVFQLKGDNILQLVEIGSGGHFRAKGAVSVSLPVLVGSLFSFLKEPLKVTKGGLKTYLSADLDAFVLKNFRGLQPVEVRKSCYENGLLDLPKSQVMKGSYIAPCPTEYLGIDSPTSCISTVKFAGSAANVWTKLSSSLQRFPIDFPPNALTSFCSLLRREPVPKKEWDRLSSFLALGPFVNDHYSIFMKFPHGGIVNVEPDYVSFILPKTNHVAIPREAIYDITEILAKAPERKEAYGEVINGVAYLVLRDGSFKVLPEEEAKKKYEVVSPTVGTRENLEKFRELLKKAYPFVDDNFVPGLWAMYTDGANVNEVLNRKTLQNFS